MRALMEDQNKKMKEILTPEQLEKYQKMIERRRQRPGGPAAAPTPVPKSDATKKTE
jgi:Spy/CpxP family protein refolding chaperone